MASRFLCALLGNLQGWLCKKKGWLRRPASFRITADELLAAEAEDDAGGDADVVLAVVVAVSEMRHQVVGLNHADGNVLCDVGIDAAAEAPGKSIIRAAEAGEVGTNMSAAEERVKVRSYFLALAVGELGTKKISDSIGVHAEIAIVINAKVASDAEPVVGVHGNLTAAAVEAEALAEDDGVKI